MAPTQPGGNPIMKFLTTDSNHGGFDFFMIYPQQKKMKAQKKFRESIDKGFKVVTIGGIHGKIVEINDNYFIIETEGTRIRIDKTAVSMEASQSLNTPAKEEKK
jgi:preprotein translocase subunit YajC